MKFYIKKICTLILTLFLVMFLTFSAFAIIPGDSALSSLGDDATKEEIEALRSERGLDRPFLSRFLSFAKGIFTGDAGQSYKYGTSVSGLIADRLPVTLFTALFAILIIIAVSFPLGIFAARFRNSIIDPVLTFITQGFMAVPDFFMGIIITYVFGLLLKWFVPGGYVSYNESFRGFLSYLVWPALAIALPKIAMLARLLKSSIQKEMGKDYVRTARSKGNSETRVLIKHVLKNAMIPVITFMGMMFAEVLAGSIVVEQVFSLPGLGRLLVTEISYRDYPVVQAIMLYIAFIVILMNFLVDMAYKRLDARIEE